METRKVLPHAEWLKARKQLLEKEKTFTKARDSLTKARQALPWERVEKRYVFVGSNGEETLSDLFDGRSQLIVYHFMYCPDWQEGCKSCSFLADHFNPAVVHLQQRDVSLVAISRAPWPTLQKYRQRMGWSFKWVSSSSSDFNSDYHVSFSPEQNDEEKAYYNYRYRRFPSTEAPGISVFFKDESGEIFHTYSVYERGLDMFITAYHFLDIVPKGRDEDALPSTMAWLRRHDEYD